MFVYEELLMKDCSISVPDLIAWEGIWGMLFSGLLLVFTTFNPFENFVIKDNAIFATY